jgi:hypothetical protein
MWAVEGDAVDDRSDQASASAIRPSSLRATTLMMRAWVEIRWARVCFVPSIGRRLRDRSTGRCPIANRPALQPLSDSDYRATAKGHKAAGTFTTDRVRGMVNVESIGNVLTVQHYTEGQSRQHPRGDAVGTQPDLLGAPNYSHQRVGPLDDDRLGPNRGHH